MRSSLFAKGHDAALIVAIEPLLLGRDLLLVGSFPQLAVERAAASAKSVTWQTREPGTGKKPRHVSVIGSIEALDAGVQFDVVVVNDVDAAQVASAHALRVLRDRLRKDGVAVIGAYAKSGDADAASGGMAYDPFCDLVEDVFGSARVFGQGAISATAFAAFDVEAEPPIVFDGTLIGDRTEAPFRFVAVHAARASQLDGYSIVQIDQPQAEAKTISTPEIAQLRDRLVVLEAELGARREEQEALKKRNEEVERVLSQRTDALAELDSEGDRLRLALKATKDESDTRQQALQHTRRELERLRAEPAAPAEDLAETENRLREVGQENTQLKLEIERRGVLVRDLVEELESTRRGQMDVSFSSQTQDAFRAAQSRIQVLEHDLQQALAARDAAASRAVDAEARAVESSFRVDELEGRLQEASTDHSASMEARLSELGARFDAFRTRAEQRIASLRETLLDLRTVLRETIDPPAPAPEAPLAAPLEPVADDLLTDPPAEPVAEASEPNSPDNSEPSSPKPPAARRRRRS